MCFGFRTGFLGRRHYSSSPLSHHLEMTSLSSTQGSAVLRLRPTLMDQHLRACIFLYFEVPQSAPGWRYIASQSYFWRGRITLTHCKTTLLLHTPGSGLEPKCIRAAGSFLCPQPLRGQLSDTAPCIRHCAAPLTTPGQEHFPLLNLKILLEYKTPRRMSIAITTLN